MDSQGKAKVALTFALYQGDQLVRRETIAQDIVKVGKDSRSHLRVDDDLASRMHAVIEVASPSDITLIDLGNEPGTLVNGQRVNKCKVRPGDQIQIGSTLIVLETAEPALAPPPQSAPVMDFGAESAPMNAPPPPPSNPFAGANPFAAAPAAASNPFAAAPSAASNPFGGANPCASAAVPAAPSSPYGAHAAPAPMAAGPGLGIEPPLDGSSANYGYSMVKSGPDVNPDEVEVAHVSSIEVMILWDSNVLHVSHLHASPVVLRGRGAWRQSDV